MHELAIAEHVVRVVLEGTEGHDVRTVRLQVGRLSGVVPEALRFSFDLATDGTRLEGAALELDEPEGRAHCRVCGDDFALHDQILLCQCGSAEVEVLAGQELNVQSVEVV